MKISGRVIAAKIARKLQKKVEKLAKKNIFPQLAIVLVGQDPASVNYVTQKKKLGEKIGVKVSLYHLSEETPKEKIKILLRQLNQNPRVHGVILQRPLPSKIKMEDIDTLIVPDKDVDGFHPNSFFTPPLVLAIFALLREIFRQDKPSAVKNNQGNFSAWLRKKRILLIGRGETGGKPLAQAFRRWKLNFQVAHRKTSDLKKLCLSSEIIISCVGKPNIVRPSMVKKETILIGVGLHLTQGKLAADYDQEKIAEKVAFYTPVPGGVGPINTVFLFQNLLSAATRR